MNKRQRNAWLKRRRSYIGGSDAAAAIGESKWKTPLQVCQDKWGTAPEVPPSKPMIRGTVLESLVVAVFKKLTGYSVMGESWMASKQWPWMAATPDGFVPELDASLQIKTVEYYAYKDSKEWGEPESPMVPDPYYIQVQHEMAVMGAKRTVLYAMVAPESVYDGYIEFMESRVPSRKALCLRLALKQNADPKTPVQFVPYVIPRDDEFIEALVEQEKAFWDAYVVPHVEPPDVTREPTIKKLLDAQPEHEDMLAQLHDSYVRQKEAEKEFEAAKKQTAEVIGEYEGILHPEFGAIKYKMPKGKSRRQFRVPRWK